MGKGIFDTIKNYATGKKSKKDSGDSYEEEKSDYEIEAEKRRKEREQLARDTSNRQKRYTKQQLGD